MLLRHRGLTRPPKANTAAVLDGLPDRFGRAGSLNWQWMSTCAPSRLARIEAAQNADGGWGYFPGKESWLEPTVYALLALREEARARAAFEKGWRLVRSWEAAGGGWGACGRVAEPYWATSLVVTLYGAMGINDAAFGRGVEWLVASRGAETRALARVAHWLSPRTIEFDAALSGWPWQTGTSSWVEPTSHALMALGRVKGRVEASGIEERIGMGKRMLLDRRCRDGGWNYGNRRVMGADLPSQPETTAVALMALDGDASIRWGEALDHMERLGRETASPLARAWIGACLLQYRGARPEWAKAEPPDGGDILVDAVESISWNRIMAAG